MANLGQGYNYRSWIRKVYAWPGWDKYVLKIDGPRHTSAADLCLPASGYDRQHLPGPA